MARATRPRNASPAGRSVWAWALFGAVLGSLGACLLFAPASWVQKAVNQASQGRLLLQDSEGTWWQGSAQLALTGGPDSRDGLRLPGRIHWTLRPGLGVLHIQLSADCCTPRPQVLAFTPGWRSWRLQLEAGESNWPAALLSGLGTPWNTVQLQGALLLKTPGLSWTSAIERTRLEGSLRLELPNLSSRLSTLRPVGSYTLQLQGGEQTTLDLRTVQGSLQLQGAGQWTGGRLHFVGEARADTGHEAELSNLLNILGRRDGARSVITLG